jgi:hypothetical protein
MLIMRLLHIVAAIWFISGLVGRNLAYAQARRAADVRVVGALLALSHRFERAMVIPGSQAVVAFGLLTAWLQGQPLLGFLQGASTNWLLASLALSLSMAPLVVFFLIPRSKLRAAAVENALARTTFTPELRAALDDSVVLGCRRAEVLVVVLILILMIVRPF